MADHGREWPVSVTLRQTNQTQLVTYALHGDDWDTSNRGVMLRRNDGTKSFIPWDNVAFVTDNTGIHAAAPEPTEPEGEGPKESSLLDRILLPGREEADGA